MSAVRDYLMSPYIKKKTTNDNTYIICEMNRSFNQEEADAFYVDIKRANSVFESDLPYERIIVSTYDNIPKEKIICKNMEYKIVKKLNETRTFLKSFIRLKRPIVRHDRKNLCNYVCKVIEENWPLPSMEYEAELKKMLEMTAKSITREMSEVFVIPREVCKKVFNESDFVNKLMLHLNETKYIKLEDAKVYTAKSVRALKEKLDQVTEIIKPFRRMVLEIDGRIQNSCFRLHYENALPVVKISDELRQDLYK